MLTIHASILLLYAALIEAAPPLPCRFQHSQDDYEYSYDLCPLLAGRFTAPMRVYVNETTPPTLTSNIYDIDVQGQLERDPTLPDELQCPRGTWICLTVSNSRPNHPSEPARITQVVPVAGNLDLNPKQPTLRPSTRLGAQSGQEYHPPLYLTLHGGMYNKRRQKALFQFHCSHDVKEPTVPTLEYSFNGTHAFSWTSSHACPITISTKPPTEPEEPVDEDPGQLPPPEADEGEEEAPQKPEPLPSPSHQVAPWPIYLSAILLLTYVCNKLLRSPKLRLRLRLWLLPHPRGPPTPETIFENLSDDNLDVDQWLENYGEEIPLTPSPRAAVSRVTTYRPMDHETQLASYGSFTNP